MPEGGWPTVSLQGGTHVLELHPDKYPLWWYLYDNRPQHADFVRHYAALGELEAALEAAGLTYADDYDILTILDVKCALDEIQHQVMTAAHITPALIEARLYQVVMSSMAAIPVRDKDGNPTGTYKYNAQAALKGLELLGKNRGMFTDRVDITSKDEKLEAPKKVMKFGDLDLEFD